MKTADYIEALKSTAPRPTVYAVAQLLGLQEETVRHWARGRRFPDAYACTLIAEALDLPMEQVLADVQAEAEKDPARRERWEGLARKFAACVVAGLATTMFQSDARSDTGRPAQSGEAEHAGMARPAIDLCTNYANYLRRLLMRCLSGFDRFPGVQLHAS